MEAHIFRVKCLTNLHVGSSDTNYSIVDNEVERDPVLQEPTIHASGIKGALRAHCEAKLQQDAKDAIVDIFGSEPGANADPTKPTTPGSYKFFSASMLARPLRVTKGEASYILSSTPEIIEAFLGLVEGLGGGQFGDINIAEIPTPGEKFYTANAADVLRIENTEATDCPALAPLGKLFGGKPFALTKSLRDYALPVLARNQLEKGISQNLWYEELVPHQSVFYFAVLVPKDDKHFDAFKKCVEGTTVQLGGNASIGYGYTTVAEVE
jgi:CRISPR-associated protein Cmr4